MFPQGIPYRAVFNTTELHARRSFPYGCSALTVPSLGETERRRSAAQDNARPKPAQDPIETKRSFNQRLTNNPGLVHLSHSRRFSLHIYTTYTPPASDLTCCVQNESKLLPYDQARVNAHTNANAHANERKRAPFLCTATASQPTLLPRGKGATLAPAHAFSKEVRAESLAPAPCTPRARRTRRLRLPRSSSGAAAATPRKRSQAPQEASGAARIRPVAGGRPTRARETARKKRAK